MIELFNPFSAPESYRACLGIDWGEQKNCIHLLAAEAGEIERFEIDADPASMGAFVRGLRQRFGAGRILAVSEQSKGALVNLLVDVEFIDLLAVNPKAAAKYRLSLHPGGSKSDPIDANALLRMLFTHRDHMSRMCRGDEPSRRLDGLSRHRRNLVAQRVQVALRLQSLLRRYYPQALGMLGAGEIWDPISLAFLRRWPCFSQLARTREQTLRQFYYTQGSRSARAIGRRLQHWRSSAALSSDTLLEQLGVIELSDDLEQLRVLNKQIHKLDTLIRNAYAQHPDKVIFSSFPAAGPAMAPRLAAVFGTDRDRFESCAQLQAYVGIAPIKIISGTKLNRTFMRRFCPKFLKQTFHEWAGLSIQFCPWAKACYRMLLDRGKGTAAAKRAIAFKWIRIMYRCWKNRTPYDENAYVQALIKRRSPIVEWMKKLGYLDEENTILFA
ncbi:MAG: IS110 family transposase [Alphaproteobacteria bacterium]|nr:MAG: IS110 family transposase [Alphaproteobacteria bacterium]